MKLKKYYIYSYSCSNSCSRDKDKNKAEAKAKVKNYKVLLIYLYDKDNLIKYNIIQLLAYLYIILLNFFILFIYDLN